MQILLIISGQTTEIVEPRDCAFHHPTAVDWNKLSCTVIGYDAFNINIHNLFSSINQLTAVTAVGLDGDDSRIIGTDLCQKLICSLGVVNVCFGYDHAQGKSIGIHRDMAFDAFDAFVAVDAFLRFAQAAAAALAVDHCLSWFSFATTFFTLLGKKLFEQSVEPFTF